MVVFQDLRISSDGMEMCIDAIIAPYSYYEGEYIDNIVITDIDKREVYNKTIAEEDHNKQLSLFLKPTDMGLSSFNNNVFYVTVTIGGYPESTTDCGWDDIRSIGVVLNWHPIYQMGMQYLREMVNCYNCRVPKNLIDYILRLKSFELALKTSNFELANTNYKKWFLETTPTIISNTCNCNK